MQLYELFLYISQSTLTDLEDFAIFNHQKIFFNINLAILLWRNVLSYTLRKKEET